MPANPIIYTDSRASLTVSESQLVFDVSKISLGAIDQIEQMATRTLNELDDTPLRDVEIIISFSEIANTKELSAPFEGIDKQRFDRLGWQPMMDNVVRHFRKDDMVMMVMLSRLRDSPGKAEIEFHFRFETEDSEAALRAVGGRLASYWGESREVLKRIYHVEVAPLETDSES